MINRLQVQLSLERVSECPNSSFLMQRSQVLIYTNLVGKFLENLVNIVGLSSCYMNIQSLTDRVNKL